MIKRLLTILMLCVSLHAVSQYFDNFRRYDIYGGLTYMKSRTVIFGYKYGQTAATSAGKDTIGGRQGTYLGPIVGFGLNLPVAKFNPNMSIGVHAAANLAVVDGLSLNIPLGLQYRFGTDATLDCDKNFGFSVGGGYNFFFVTGDLGDGIFKYPYVSPEISFNTGIGLLKVKSYIQFTEQFYSTKTDTETHHAYLSAPLIVCLAICPNFDD